ncbi:MAG TPA: FecR family protein, partial [Gemmatimonadaceae bacterium]|nr:FecR family protein [Gemmatimonadaceae bacterium]
MTRLLSVVSRVRSIAFIAGLLWIAAPAFALAQPPEVVNPESLAANPPAHVSFVDGAAVLERDGQPDTSPANMPLLAGDRLRTQGGRVEILFADGSALHVDANTTLDFQSDELVRLLDGRIRLSIPGPNRGVSYRIDASSASALITEPGEYRLAVL